MSRGRVSSFSTGCPLLGHVGARADVPFGGRAPRLSLVRALAQLATWWSAYGHDGALLVELANNCRHLFPAVPRDALPAPPQRSEWPGTPAQTRCCIQAR